MSHAKINTPFFRQIVEALAYEFTDGCGPKAQKMRNLSFAYVRVSEIGPDPTPYPLDEEGNPIIVAREEDEFSDANLISDGLAQVLELSQTLMHADLSGMNLREKCFKLADAIKKN